jgi:hypothetical protein
MSGSLNLPIKRPLKYEEDFVLDFDDEELDEPMKKPGKARKSSNACKGPR